jgi:prefoldin subunit 5
MTEELKTTPETTPSKEKMIVEIDEGLKVEMSVEDAKKYIERKDKRSKNYKELSEKVTKAEQEKANALERARLVELSKEQKFDELRNELTKATSEKLSKVSQRIIKKELESALLNSDDFIKELKDDAVQLLHLNHSFVLDENMEKVVSSDGKEVVEVVKEWLAKKDAFKRAKTGSGTGAKIGPQGNDGNRPKNVQDNFSKGVGKLFGN